MFNVPWNDLKNGKPVPPIETQESKWIGNENRTKRNFFYVSTYGTVRTGIKIVIKIG